jgi:hypothetical protein
MCSSHGSRDIIPSLKVKRISSREMQHVTATNKFDACSYRLMTYQGYHSIDS